MFYVWSEVKKNCHKTTKIKLNRDFEVEVFITHLKLSSAFFSVHKVRHNKKRKI